MIRTDALSGAFAFVGCVAMGLGLSACGSSADPSSDGADARATAVGNLNVEFHLPTGSVSTATYRLTGPNGYSKGSSLDFMGSQVFGFFVANVPAGNGYTLSFNGSDDGGESCMGMTTFNVTNGQTAMVNVDATCIGGPYVPSGYGGIETWVNVPRQTSLASAQCSLIGPAGIEANQSLTVSGMDSLHFTLSQVPAGNGQVLTLTAVTTTNAKCNASATVNVVANQTAVAMVALACQ
jgi:hypothetical protein